MTKNKIISIQSRLVYGYVGTNIAELAIQLQGLDIIAFPTVMLSAHSGHQPMYGEVISEKLFKDLITGIKAIDIIKEVSCVISGYIRTKEIIEASSNFIKEIKKDFPDKLYICDPVMGETGIGLFIPEDIAQQIIEELIPISDILTPNHYELEYILQQKIETEDALTDALKKNDLLKGKTVIITGCIFKDSKKDKIDTFIFINGTITRIEAPRVDTSTVGTGDLFTATLASQLAQGYTVIEAVKNTTLYISKILNYMVSKGYEEMNAECLLVANLKH